MEFSRAIAIACFTGAKWLMVVTGTLFLVLAAVQHLRVEPNAQPLLTIGTGIACLVLAYWMHVLVKRIQNMNGR